MSDAMQDVMAQLDGQINNAGETNVNTTEAPQLETEENKKDPQFIHMPLTPELLTACRAQAGTMALGPWLQARLAEQLGVELPVKVDARQRYFTKEEKAAAKVRSANKAANLRKGLLMAHRARSAGDKEALAIAEKLIADNS